MIEAHSEPNLGPEDKVQPEPDVDEKQDMPGEMVTESRIEKEEHDVHPGAFSDTGKRDVEHDPTQDVEALATVQSNLPPYSVFSKRQKMFIVIMAACGGFFSPLSANIYFPALTTLSKDFHVTSTLMNLTLTSYMIFQGLAPTIFGDLADMAGRRPAYTIGFVIYIGANIGLALQSSYAALLVLRCLQSSGASATIALGSGIVADIATVAERGTYMGYVTSVRITLCHVHM
jgi:hypothetical protein